MLEHGSANLDGPGIYRKIDLLTKEMSKQRGIYDGFEWCLQGGGNAQFIFLSDSSYFIVLIAKSCSCSSRTKEYYFEY